MRVNQDSANQALNLLIAIGNEKPKSLPMPTFSYIENGEFYFEWEKEGVLYASTGATDYLDEDGWWNENTYHVIDTSNPVKKKRWEWESEDKGWNTFPKLREFLVQVDRLWNKRSLGK